MTCFSRERRRTMRIANVLSWAVLVVMTVLSGNRIAAGGTECDEGWNAMEGGMAVGEFPPPFVTALEIFDDGSGSGPGLYVGGWFSSAGGVPASCVARWDEDGWSSVGLGPTSTVRDFAVFDDGLGGGPALYAAGNFLTAGGQSAKRIARWNGSSWSPLGEGLDGTFGIHARALAVYDDGINGPELYVAGFFFLAGEEEVQHIARWNGTSWSALTGPGVEDLNDRVNALAVFDDGSGPALYVGGQFTSAGGVTVNRIARWNGVSWSSVGGGMNSSVHALQVFDDGNGPALYAGGWFSTAGGVSANGIARWDGQSWSEVGDGVDGGVYALAAAEGEPESEPKLYVGGDFTQTGGSPANRIARWDGSSWSSLGSGVSHATEWSEVLALIEFDDQQGSGPATFVGGIFEEAGQEVTNSIAKWIGCPEGSVLWGTVFDVFTQEPLKGATIAIIGGPSTVTEKDGTYVLSDIQPATVLNGVVSMPGYPIKNWLMMLGPGEHEKDFNLGEPSSIVGYVLDSMTGQPLSDVSVAVVGGPSTNTLADGYYELENVMPGDHIVTATMNAYLAQYEDVSLDPVTQVQIDFTLEPVGGHLLAVDPNRPLGALLQDGDVMKHDTREKAQQLALHGSTVVGLMADGVTRVLLSVEVDGPGTITFTAADDQGGNVGVGILGPPGLPSIGTEYVGPAVFAGDDAFGNERWYGFAVLKAPPDFVRNEGDKLKPWRHTVINAVFQPTGGDPLPAAELSLLLRRPPVVKMHGLWSDADTWGWNLSFWIPGLYVYKHNYTNDAPFAYNASVAKSAINSVLNDLRSIGFACTQVEYIGHSMGGLLGRLYVGEYFAFPPYYHETNFNEGDINRLITVNTPHKGSHIANLLLDTPLYYLGETFAYWAGLGCVQCGAVEDLRTDNPAILNLPEAEVPSHAMVSVGGSDIVSIYGNLITDEFDLKWVSVLLFLLPDETVESMFNGIFPGDQHDLIVALDSQVGQLSAFHQSFFNYTGPDQAIHTSVTADWQNRVRVIQLLNTPVGDSSTFADSFPAAPGGLLPPLPPPPPGDPPIGLVITEPAGGRVVEPGDAVTVTVEALPGFVPESVMIVTPDNAYLTTGPAFVADIQVPISALGDFSILAFGKDANDEFFVAKPVFLDIQTSAQLVQIKVEPKTYHLFEFAPEVQIHAAGLFDDWQYRNVTAPATGTQYSSDNSVIASVDEHGLVTAHSTGQATVTVMNSGVTATVTIQAVDLGCAPCDDGPCAADLNDDGVVNVSDLLILLGAWGKCSGCPSDCLGDINCDGSVNVFDLLLLLGSWGPCTESHSEGLPPEIQRCFENYEIGTIEFERCLEAAALNGGS